jgi:hypothetical protein
MLIEHVTQRDLMTKSMPPRQHLRRVMRFARRTARQHGHSLGPWCERQASPFWRREAECQKCGAIAFIESEVDPTKFPGEPELIGDALSEPCKF